MVFRYLWKAWMKYNAKPVSEVPIRHLLDDSKLDDVLQQAAGSSSSSSSKKK